MQHYPCCMGKDEQAMFRKAISEEEWRKLFGGAIYDAFQPLPQLMRLKRLYPERFDDVGCIVPMNDFVTSMFLDFDPEHLGHEFQMLKSMGLDDPRSYPAFDRHVSSGLSDKICPWPEHGPDWIAEKDGCYFTDFSHDSPWSRAVAFGHRCILSAFFGGLTPKIEGHFWSF